MIIIWYSLSIFYFVFFSFFYLPFVENLIFLTCACRHRYAGICASVCAYVHCECIFLHICDCLYLWVCVSVEARKRHRIIWRWSYRLLWATRHGFKEQKLIFWKSHLPSCLARQPMVASTSQESSSPRILSARIIEVCYHTWLLSGTFLLIEIMCVYEHVLI